MATDTILYRKGSTFEYQGVLQDASGAPMPIEASLVLKIYETFGAGMQDLAISVIDGPSGTFKVSLSEEESKKLPEGRSSWFKILFDYEDTTKKVVFPPLWINVQ
jgi:hypothetical protein